MPLALDEHRLMADIGDYVPSGHSPDGYYLVGWNSPYLCFRCDRWDPDGGRYIPALTGEWFCCACAEGQRVGVLRGYKAERVRERRRRKADLRSAARPGWPATGAP